MQSPLDYRSRNTPIAKRSRFGLSLISLMSVVFLVSTICCVATWEKPRRFTYNFTFSDDYVGFISVGGLLLRIQSPYDDVGSDIVRWSLPWGIIISGELLILIFSMRRWDRRRVKGGTE